MAKITFRISEEKKTDLSQYVKEENMQSITEFLIYLIDILIF